MSEIKLVRTQRLYYRDVEYIVDGRLPGGEFLFRTPCHSKLVTLTEDGLRRALGTGELCLVRAEKEPGGNKNNLSSIDIEALEESDRAAMNRAHSYVEAFRKAGITAYTKRTLKPIIDRVALEIGDKRPPAWNTGWRWSRLFRLSGNDIRSLIPAHAYKGSIDPKKPDRVKEIVEECIADNGGGTSRFSIAAIYRAALCRIDDANKLLPPDKRLPLVSERYVYRVFDELDLYTREKLRRGAKEAGLAYRPIHGVPDPKLPLSIVEIDHTQVNLWVIDDKTGIPLGRPWLTVAIDRATRMIVGFHIGFRGPSYDVVAESLRQAILPKDYVKEEYPRVENEWKPWGRIGTILVDRGMEFRSQPLKDACHILDVRIEWTERRKPWHKGKVERFFRTIAEELFHTLPGAARPLPQRRDEEKPWKGARITLSGLRLVVHMWMIDFYCQKPHRGIKMMAPAQKWEELTARYPIEPFSSVNDLDVLLGRVVENVDITNAGIRRRGLRYQSDFLTELLIRPQKITSVTIKELEFVDAIGVLDPHEGRYRLVPIVRDFAEYASGVTWHQHDIISRHARAETKSSAVSILTLCRTRAKIQQIALSEWKRPTPTGKAMVARFLNIDKAKEDPLGDDFIVIENGPQGFVRTDVSARRASPQIIKRTQPKASVPPIEILPPEPPSSAADNGYAAYAKSQNWTVRKR